MSNNSSRKYKCPYCDYRDTREELVDHLREKHNDMIPQNYTPARVVFNFINKKDHGSCIVCGNNTKWNEKNWKYDRLCGSKSCSNKLREVYKKNMMKRYGKTTLLNDAEQQEKMLASRSISGKYKFKDGGIRSYVGTYEHKCLEFFDLIIEAKSDDILTPGPVFEYEFKGKTLQWITDIYYVPANLVIEIKDGGNNPNNRDMKEYREKQIAKEKMIAEKKQYNYLRLTNNNFQQLIFVLAELKHRMIDDANDIDPLVYINEEVGGIPPAWCTDVYITNDPVKNTFDDEDVDGINENVFFHKENLEFNLDKWDIGNPLWITGTSGDGKTTLANKIAEENNAIVCHTDYLLIRICRTKYDFNGKLDKLKTKDPLTFKFISIYNSEIPWNDGDIKHSWDVDKDIKKEWFDKYFNWIIKESKNINKKIIVEGCDITLLDADLFVGRPLIILNNPVLISSIRRIKRDNLDDGKIVKNILKEIQRQNSYIKDLNESRDKFINKMIKLDHFKKLTIENSDDNHIEESSNNFKNSIYVVNYPASNAFDKSEIGLLKDPESDDIIIKEKDKYKVAKKDDVLEEENYDIYRYSIDSLDKAKRYKNILLSVKSNKSINEDLLEALTNEKMININENRLMMMFSKQVKKDRSINDLLKDLSNNIK